MKSMGSGWVGTVFKKVSPGSSRSRAALASLQAGIGELVRLPCQVCTTPRLRNGAFTAHTHTCISRDPAVPTSAPVHSILDAPLLGSLQSVPHLVEPLSSLHKSFKAQGLHRQPDMHPRTVSPHATRAAETNLSAHPQVYTRIIIHQVPPPQNSTSSRGSPP